MNKEYEMHSELIRLFVSPRNTNNEEFHEVSPAQLEEFLKEKKNIKPELRHKRNQYHELAIMAKVDRHTTDADIEMLLHNDVRTLLVQKNYNRRQDLEQIFFKINNCVNNFYSQNVHTTPIGVAVEIQGELLITGRMRNDKSVRLEKGNIIVLSSNEEYRECCYKEIVYVSNLWKYSKAMRVGDVVAMGMKCEIVARVVRCGSMQPLTVKVTKPGLLDSFMRLKVPYYIEGKELNQKDVAIIDEAIRHGAHFLMIPGIRSAAFIATVKEHIGENVGLIGSIDLAYLESKFIDVADLLMQLDGVVLEDMFSSSSQKILENAIAQCKKHEKPLVGTVPLTKCSDFKKLENHMRIRQMDCLLIQKSPVRMKFPLIAKKLLPVGNQKPTIQAFDNSSLKDSIINFILRTIHSIPCRGIIVTSSCPKVATAFSNFQIYCPVIVVVDSDHKARLLNLRKNFKTVVCLDDTPLMDLGINFGRKQGIFSTGDFIISISDCVEDGSSDCIDLRAYFLRPTAEELIQ